NVKNALGPTCQLYLLSLFSCLYSLSLLEAHGAASAPARLEVLEQMEPWVEQHLLPLLKPAEEDEAASVAAEMARTAARSISTTRV
ncbi:Os06g0503850, partial [Oryza sativa Japonica Group]